MKKIFKIALGLVAGLFTMVSCSEDDEVSAFQLDKSEITIGAEGGDETVVVTSSDEWVAESSHPWIMISPANGIGTTECRIVVDSSLVNDIRTASVRFSPKGQAPQMIQVRQTGFNKMIALEHEEINLESSARKDERFFEVVVSTNVKFKLELQDESGKTIDWLKTKDTEVDLDRGARPRTLKMRFDWRINTKPEKRVAKVNFLPQNEEDELSKPAVLTINQEAAPQIEDSRAGDSLALIILQERFNMTYNRWNVTENLRNWENVVLWEAGDKYTDYSSNPEGEEKKIPNEFVGRVRAVRFAMINLEEALPQEIKHLKYLETLMVQSNPNVFLKTLELGTDVCELEHLKALRVYSYGLIDLPKEFAKLGNTLEALDLGANNLIEVPEVLTPENFPHLTYLNLLANRRWTCIDLREEANYENGLGFHFKVDKSGDNSLRRLFKWENLEYLSLSNNYLEGEIPDFEVGKEGITAYTQEDVNAFGSDTLQNLVDKKVDGKLIPKILPKIKGLSLNLNFFTGKIPNWILYHPHFIEWDPVTLLFNQQEKGLNSDGNLVGFDNAPSDFEYYFQFYPKYRKKFEFNDMQEEEAN